MSTQPGRIAPRIPVVILVSCVCLFGMAPASAHAQSESVLGGDNRPEDRFFAGMSTGIASQSRALATAPAIDDPATAVSLETTYWPNDYLTMGVSYDVETFAGGASTGFGTFGALAVPLRYVQLYAGGWIGARYQVGGERDIDRVYHPLAGINVYARRNLRLFAQWQSIRLDADTDGRAQVVTAGLRWSPQWFHQLRRVDKLNAVWLSGVAMVVAFLGLGMQESF
jgi:hypothetical protein